MIIYRESKSVGICFGVVYRGTILETLTEMRGTAKLNHV
jgi:hypothetical protein